MGTDIHCVFQKYQNENWIYIPSNYDERRDYLLFSTLANVRNWANIPPIDLPRGLPPAFQIDSDQNYQITSLELSQSIDDSIDDVRNTDSHIKIWLGDDSYSWLTGDELLGWYSAPQPRTLLFYVPYPVYKLWDKKDFPNHFYHGLSQLHHVFKEQQCDLATEKDYIEVVWHCDIRTQVAYFFEEVRRLTDLYGNIRVVFGFDH